MKSKEQEFPCAMYIGNMNNPEKYFELYYSWEVYDKNKIYDLKFEKDSKNYEVYKVMKYIKL